MSGGKKPVWRFTAWKSRDPSNEEWQGIARLNGDIVYIDRTWRDDRKSAVAAAKTYARNHQPTPYRPGKERTL